MKKIKAFFLGSRKRITISGFIIILAATAGYFYYSNVFQPTQTATDEPALQTAAVRRGDLIIYASGSGTLISANEASFGFETSGQVIDVFVGVGDDVVAEQVLAQLDDTSAKSDLTSAQRESLELTSLASIATAEQRVFDAEDALNSARATLGWLVSPSVVTWEEREGIAEVALQDAKAAGETSEKIAEAEKTLQQAQANLNFAKNAYYDYLRENFAETETINSRGGSYEVVVRDENGKIIINYPTDIQIGLARSEYELAKANLQEARWYLAVLKGEEIPDSATGSSLVTLENAHVNLDNAQSGLDSTKLVAPISGTIMSLDFSVGDTVGTASVVTIADLSQPYLEVFLDESDWANISVGYPVEVIFDILPERIFTGDVIQVDPGLYTSGNTSVVRAMVKLDANESFNLPLGTSAAVDVIGGQAENAILVPVEALRETSPGAYAVFVVEDGKPRLRAIEVGIKDILYAEVKSGLDVGEIVTTGITETQ
ncbi:MAG TPA: efflux RND transporter periplasmic adaptor subunit [Anaerolineales bacterium]|nr:efflux RND transporter periplasmic adaptor subunit [Anaerolineales bacterium]